MLQNSLVDSAISCKICSIPLVTHKKNRNKKYCNDCKKIVLLNQKRLWDFNKRAKPYRLEQFYTMLKDTLRYNPYII